MVSGVAGNRHVYKRGGTLKSITQGIRNVPQHNWTEKNREVTGKNYFGVHGSLKTCTQVFEQTSRASLFPNFLKLRTG